MKARTPAEVFPPGEFIREEMEARGWSQVELAAILGRSPRLVNEILNAKRGISPDTAKSLGDAFSTSAEYWLNLEASYQLSRVRNQDDGVARRARLYTKAPIREMIKRNWIESSDNIDVLETQVRSFFEVDDLGEEPRFLPYAARKSTAYGAETAAQVAWLYRAKHLARAVSAGPFSQERLKEAIVRLQRLRHSVEEIRHVPRILAEHGIRLLIIEPLPRTRIDGACFWLDSESPVIVISMRFDRIDYFWYTLMHELGHVKNGDGRVTLDLDLVGANAEAESEKPDYEVAADQFAAEAVLAQAELNKFIVRTDPLYSKLKIVAFATRIGIHPGIVVGQLQHRGRIAYTHSRDLLAKVRHIITQSALTDGWGSVLPASL